MLIALKQRYKQFYRLDNNVKASEKFRLTVTVITASIFFVIQFINLIAAFLVMDGGLRFDHISPVIAVAITGGSLVALRKYRPFFVYAMIVVLSIVAIVVSSGYQTGLGLYDDGLPFLPIAILLAALISGWRAALIGGIICFLGLGALTVISLSSADTVMAAMDAATHESRTTLRVLQALFACATMMLIASLISRYLHVLFDNMEKDVEEALIAEKKQARFLANMSHELRSPLNGIISMSDLLIKDGLTPRQDQFAKIVHDSSQHLVSLINDVLDMAKLDSDTLTLRSDRFDVHELISQLVALYRPMSTDKGLELRSQIFSNVPQYLMGDAARLRQIISNLVGNAIKYTEEGQVVLSVKGEARADKFCLRVYIQDTGIGIPEELQEHVFDRFGQVDNEISSKRDSTGLGLAICKEIVDLMGGTLKLVSVVGQGSMFYFDAELPVAAPEAANDDVKVQRA